MSHFNLRTAFFQHIAQTSNDPLALTISHGNGCHLFDCDGKQYIDLISGISVSSLGHNNPEIFRTVSEQLQKHLHVMVFGEYILSPQVRLAEAITSILAPSLNKVYFTNSGAEAIEGAIKLAKGYSGRSEIIACKNGYHGSTNGALSLMGNETYKRKFRPLLPDIGFIEFNNHSSLKLITKKTAAVFIEPVQSETGYIPATQEFIHELRTRCNQTGALLVIDEAQSGFGRTGRYFGFEHYNILPDILVLAKALGGGFPLGAFIASDEIMNTLSSGAGLGHLTTFGGHPVSCAASLAAVQIITQTGFCDEVERKGNVFRQLLFAKSQYFQITGKGLMIALHFYNETLCRKVIHNCLEKGVIADWFLFAPNSLRISPPLIITDELITEAADIIIDSVAKSI